MKTILRFPVALTPLSPIHVGCGQYYDPTEYLIKEGVLYAFDPLNVNLKPSQLQELGKIAKENNPKGLALFYKKNEELYLPMTRALVPVDSSFESNYRKTFTPKISKLENPKSKDKIINQCLADRTAYFYDRNGLSQAYIPGSGIKGTIHTALLDRLNRGQPRQEKDNLDVLVLEGSLNDSPMRQLRISDFLCQEEFTTTRVLAAKRVKKTLSIFDAGIPNYLECILPGQSRIFRGEIALEVGINGNQYAYQSLKEIFADLNRYYLTRFQKEIHYEYSSKWLQGMCSLLSTIQDQLNNGSLALIRVGKNIGAENIVLHEGIAKIRRGKLGISSSTSTVWKCNYDGQCLPFGWALLDLMSSPCVQLEKLLQFTTVNTEQLRIPFSDFLTLRSHYLSQQAEHQARLEEDEKVRLAKEETEKARQNMLDSLSENMRLVHILAEKLLASSRAVKPGTTLYIETMSLLGEALTWPLEEQKVCAQLLAPLIKKRDMYQGKDAKILKTRIKELKHE